LINGIQICVTHRLHTFAFEISILLVHQMHSACKHIFQPIKCPNSVLLQLHY